MKFCLVLLAVFLLANSSLAQNQWDLQWTLDQKPFQDPQTGSEMAVVKAGFDTDEDGWGEFLCAYTDLDSNYVLMYEASADNTYDLVWWWKYPVVANTFAGITVGDLDDNGVVEIITTMPSVTTTDPNPPRLWIFEWNGVQGENNYGNYDSGSLEPHGSWNYDVDDNIDIRPYSLTIEDIDGDGKSELITGVRTGSNGQQVIVASVTGFFTSLFAWTIEYHLQGSFGGSLYSTTTGDLDGDGNREIYAQVWNNFTLKIIEATGADQYQLVTDIVELYAPQAVDHGALDGVRVADVNNDGTNELYIASTEDPNQVFMITGITDVQNITGSDVQEFYKIPVNVDGGFRSMQIADVDGDGNQSLMIAGERNGQVYDLEYMGSGDPADSANWELSVLFNIYDSSGVGTSLTPRIFYGHPAADMDGDGHPEYVFVNYSTDFSVWNEDAYVWVIEATGVTAIRINNPGLPQSITLGQNYPNPFNPTTTLEYALPEGRQVTLAVYNTLGQEVAVLVNGYQASGDHRVVFDASDLPSGTYYARLRTEGPDGTSHEMLSRKMTLVR